MNLSKGSMRSHIRSIALPASIGFFFNTMYNVVDTFYAGMVSTEALAALSISFPIFFIMIAVGSGISQGSTALISNALGEKNLKKARSYVHQGLSFSFILGVSISIIGLFLTPFAFNLLGAEGEYLSMALAYMNTILMGAPLFLILQTGNSSLIAQGDTKSFRNMLIVGFLLNIILNPMFLFGFMFIPAMGLSGIAFSTVLVQLLGCIYIYSRVRKTKIWTPLAFKRLIPLKRVYLEITGQGFPASLNMMTIALGMFIITFFVSSYGTDAVAAFGIAIRVEQIAVLPAIGLNMALVSIVGQNNGARRLDRVREARMLAQRYGLYMAVIGGLLTLIFARPMMSLFADNPEVISIGVDFLRVMAFSFFGFMLYSQTASILKGLKMPFNALWLTLVRQLVLPIIILSILTYLIEASLLVLWFGLLANTWIIAVFSILYMNHVLFKKENLGKDSS